MTTSLQFLAQQISPFLTVADLAALSASDRATICTAINAALTWFDTNAPAPLRNRPWNGTLRATRTVTVNVTHGSQAFSFDTDPGDFIGCTLVIDGDSRQNRVHSATELKLPFLGTTGARTATLYGDGIALPSGFISLNDLLWYERADNTRRVIIAYANQAPWSGPVQVNEPWFYTIEQGMSLDGTAPFSILRFLYATGSDCSVSTHITAHPTAWTLADFRTARTLDLQDHHWTLLAPLVIAKLLTKPNLIATSKVDPRLLLADAEDARQQIRNLPVPSQGAPPAVLTPSGF